MIDPLSIAAIFAPALVKAGEAAIARFLPAPQPPEPTYDQRLQAQALDLEALKVINQQPETAPVYPWVDAIVRLQRPAFVAITAAAWLYVVITDADPSTVAPFAQTVAFYLFGDRTLFHIQQRKPQH